MNIADRILSWVARQRGFVLGPGVIEWGDEAWGHDKTEYAPEIYGSYITSSNAVYTCATLRASLLASLPIKIYRRNRAKERVEVERGPLVDLLGKVNPWWTRWRLMYMSELTLCLWGEATWALERGKSGRGAPREIWWARPDRMSILPDPVKYIKGFLYEPLNGSADIAFEPQEVIWIPYPNPLDEYAGLSPLAAARGSADYATEAVRANTNLFRAGLQIGGMIMPPKESHRELTAEQARELDAYFARRFQGQDKAHRWATLRHNYEVWEGGTTPKEADFLGGLNWSLEDVARAYKVPLDLVGGQRTYQNVEAALKALWAHCILPEAEFFATELTEKLLPMFPAQAGDEVAFDVSKVAALQEAEGDKWGRAMQQLEKGALTVNEWRDEVGKEAKPWGDVWWAPTTVTPVGGELAATAEGEGDPSRTGADILGYHIEQGVVTRNEARAELGLPAIDESKDTQLRELKALLSVVQAAVNTGVSLEAALKLVGMESTLGEKEEDGQQQPPQLQDGQTPPEEPPAELPPRILDALTTLRRRQRASILARTGAPEPFEYARWVKEYRIALRAAGASEADAQRLAYELNTRAYDALRAISAGELPEKVDAVLEVVS